VKATTPVTEWNNPWKTLVSKSYLARILHCLPNESIAQLLAVSLQPYLLFVCLPWLLPFASRFFCFFFDPDHIFFLTKNQQTVKTLKGERAPQGGEKGTGRQLKPNCDSVFYLFTVCQQVYSPFQQLRATFLELCFSFLVATLD